MTLANYSLWSALIGARVEIRHSGAVIRTGIVEDAAADSSVLWIAAEGIEPRAMYEAALGYEAWVKRQMLNAGTCFQYRMTTENLYPRSRPFTKGQVSRSSRPDGASVPGIHPGRGDL